MRAGDVLEDRFEVQGRAGAGGMGVVFRAVDWQTGQPAAVKLIADPAGAQRFAREAHVLSLLDHDAIVGYVAHGSAGDGTAYLAMQWLNGQTLAERVTDEGPLSAAGAIALGLRLCSGLEAAHARGIVHRDLKPSNVFLRNGRAAEAVLVDFGVARLDEADPGLTVEGTILGTPAYMAPEQARSLDVDARADIYALGCTLLYALTGQPPFEGGRPLSVLVRVILDPPPVAERLRNKVSQPLVDLLTRMMAKSRDDRPSTARGVSELLREIPLDVTTNQGAPALPQTKRSFLVGRMGGRKLGAVSSHGPHAELLADGTLFVQAEGEDAVARLRESALALLDQSPTLSLALLQDDDMARAAERAPALLGRARPGTLLLPGDDEGPRTGEAALPPPDERGSPRAIATDAVPEQEPGTLRSSLAAAASSPRGWWAVALVPALVLAAGMGTRLAIAPRVDEEPRVLNALASASAAPPPVAPPVESVTRPPPLSVAPSGSARANGCPIGYPPHVSCDTWPFSRNEQIRALDFVRVARALAERVEASARMDLCIWKALAKGKVDAASSLCKFAFGPTVDNTWAGNIVVDFDGSWLTAIRAEAPSQGSVLPAIPTCDSDGAWDAIVRSGLPTDGSFQMSYFSMPLSVHLSRTDGSAYLTVDVNTCSQILRFPAKSIANGGLTR